MRKRLLDARLYRDLDYVLALDDFSRIGALCFRRSEGGGFLAEGGNRLPPVLRPGALVAAADAIHHETETAQDLRFLLGAGSPLGGARPEVGHRPPQPGAGHREIPETGRHAGHRRRGNPRS